MDFSCLVLAAGKGRRFGSPKQHYSWRGTQLWSRAYNTLRNVTAGDIVVVGLDIPGGRTRQESVTSGLRLIDTDRVVIFESARPLATEQEICDLLEEEHPSVTFGSKIDTPVYSFKTKKFLKPNGVRVIQNLQCFDTKLLKEAHEKTRLTNAPDDTIVMHEALGIEPRILDANMFNLWKIVVEDDIYVLNALAYSQNREDTKDLVF